MSSLPSPLTLTYSTAGKLELKLNLHLPPNATGALPAIVCFHGGYLIVGDRQPGRMSAVWLLEMAMTHRVVFISPDYHLLHPSTGFDELADVKALFHFLSDDVNSHLPEGITLDASRIAVAGVSAGGYLARLAALHAEPRPRAVLSMFGMGGDWLLDHYLTVKTAPSLFSDSMISKEDVAHLENSEPVVEVPIVLNPATGRYEDENGRMKLLPFWWQRGDFVDHLTGKVGLSERLRSLPPAEREAAVPADVAKLFPQLHIDASFPPTMLIHGEKDTGVSPSESEYTHKQLQKVGVRSELHIVPGAEHGLVILPEGKSAPQAEGLYKEAFEFLGKEIA